MVVGGGARGRIRGGGVAGGGGGRGCSFLSVQEVAMLDEAAAMCACLLSIFVGWGQGEGAGPISA